MRSITGCFVRLLNSVEFAPFNPHTCLAKSIIAHCIPKHIPKNGMLFSRAYFEDKIFPSLPREPKPGKIKIPSTSLNCLLADLSLVILSVFTHLIFTLALFSTPACTNDSSTLLYESISSVYLPHIAIVSST